LIQRTVKLTLMALLVGFLLSAGWESDVGFSIQVDSSPSAIITRIRTEIGGIEAHVDELEDINDLLDELVEQLDELGGSASVSTVDNVLSDFETICNLPFDDGEPDAWLFGVFISIDQGAVGSSRARFPRESGFVGHDAGA